MPARLDVGAVIRRVFDVYVDQLLRAVTPVLGQLVLVALVAGIVTGIGFFLIIVPGLVLLTIWSVAAPVVVLEHPGGLGALGRSRDLVRGNGWQVLGVVLILVILVAIVAAVIEVLGASAGAVVGILAWVVVGVLTAPLSALAAAVLYFQLSGSSAKDPDGTLDVGLGPIA
jgi:hypothetical protein